ncbi:HPP family protein [Streptomyces sp. NPDC050418]|uniref:HPP family protein n=1 Tax=Streptomyces sp. NPDC050418 TaxID=3365612 RepID=UPI00379FE813
MPSPTRPTRRDLPHLLRVTAFAIGALLALTLVGGILHQPLLIPPLAASATLVHSAPGLPLAQPRNVIAGHLVSALIGFATLAVTGPGPWGAGVAAGLSLGAMMLTHTSHAPATATALIVVLQSPDPTAFLALLALGTTLVVALGMLPGRIGRHPVRYPVTW